MPSTAANLVQLSDHQVIAALRDSPIAKEAAAKRTADLLAERKRNVAAIGELERVAGAAFQNGQVALAAAIEKLRAAETALQAARNDYQRVMAENIGASMRNGAERDRLEAVLRETSIPAVDEFIRWAWNELEVAQRRHVVSDVMVTRSALTGRKIVTAGESNLPSIHDRMRGCREAIEKAEAMRFVADQANVQRQLDELRDGMPKIS